MVINFFNREVEVEETHIGERYSDLVIFIQNILIFFKIAKLK